MQCDAGPEFGNYESYNNYKEFILISSLSSPFWPSHSRTNGHFSAHKEIIKFLAQNF